MSSQSQGHCPGIVVGFCWENSKQPEHAWEHQRLRIWSGRPRWCGRGRGSVDAREGDALVRGVLLPVVDGVVDSARVAARARTHAGCGVRSLCTRTRSSRDRWTALTSSRAAAASAPRHQPHLQRPRHCGRGHAPAALLPPVLLLLHCKPRPQRDIDGEHDAEPSTVLTCRRCALPLRADALLVGEGL
jgi:hypothetical protein